MCRFYIDELIFDNPKDMIESVLNICKNYDVYNISAKLISTERTEWHK